MGKLIRYRTFAVAVGCAAALAMVGAGAGDAASSPAVTEPATSVTSTSAALNGLISPGGLDTFWGFQWGTSTAYDQNTTPAGPLTDNGSDSVMAPLRNLRPGTTYHFRLIAVQGAGGASGSPTLTAGADETFTTSGSSGNPSGGGGGTRHSHASLHGRTFTVHRGHTQVAWGCSGAAGASCSGTFSLAARGRRCGAGTFTAATGRNHTVRVAVPGGCVSLLQHARHHRVAGSLRATFSVGTGNLRTGVTLVLR